MMLYHALPHKGGPGRIHFLDPKVKTISIR
jgi:hypothetical protein